MEIITIESKAYQELTAKIDTILRYVKKEAKQRDQQQERLITNEDLAEILGISTRTLQRLRSTDRISYKIIYRRCYYDLNDVERAIREGTLHCNPTNMKELHRNFKLKSTRAKHGTIG